MFRKYNRFKEDYLLKVETDIVRFQKITKIKIKNSNPIAFCHLENSGQVTIDILSGITFETTHTAFVSEHDYNTFLTLLNEATEIADINLIEYLPLTVHPRFEAPF